MSDAIPPSSPAPISPGRKNPPARKPGKWRRRLAWSLAIVVGVLLLIRVSLIFILPAVIEHVAGFYGLTTRYEQIKLDVLGGDVGIWGLELLPKAGGKPVITAEYCHGNISVGELLLGRLYIRRVEADGARVELSRNAAGHGPLLDAIMKGVNANSSTQAASSQPTSLSSPLRVQAFRLEHMRLHIHDQSITPTVNATLTLSVRVSDLGLRGQPTRFSLDFWSSELLDMLRLDGSFHADGSSLAAKADIFMRGLHLQPLAGYLRPLGVVPHGSGLSLQAQSRLDMHIRDGGPKVNPGFTAHFVLQNLRLTSGDISAFRLNQFAADAVLTTGLADITHVRLVGLKMRARRLGGGAFQFAGLNFLPAHSHKPAAALPVKPKPELIAAKTPVKAAAGTLNGGYKWAVDTLAMRDCKLAFDDATVTPAAHIAIQLNTLSALSRGGLPGQPGEELVLSGNAMAPGLAHTINISGSMLPFAPKKTLDVHVAADGITATALKPYLSRAGLQSELTDAALNLELKASLAIDADGSMTTSLQLDHLNYTNGPQTLLALSNVDVTSMHANARTGRFEVGSIKIVGPSLAVNREKSGLFSVLGMRLVKPVIPLAANAAVVPAQGKPANMHAVASSAADVVLPRLQVDNFSWTGVHVQFNDQKVSPVTHFSISDAGLIVHQFVLDMANPGAKPITGTIQAWLNAPGLTSGCKLKGVLTRSRGKLAAAVRVSGSQINLQPLKPYLLPLGIMPRLQAGSFHANLQAAVADARGTISASLHADNVQLLDGTTRLAGLTDFNAADIVSSSNGFAVGDVTINQPWLRLKRRRSGALECCGIALVPAAAAAATGASAPKIPPAQTAGNNFVTNVAHLALHNATLHWIDHDVRKPVDISVAADVSLQHFVLGRPTAPLASLAASVAIPQVARQISLSGQVSPGSQDTILNLHLQGSGLLGGPLAIYLPPGFHSDLHDGKVQGDIHLRIRPAAAGGRQITASLSNGALYTSAAAAKPAIAIPLAAVHVTRLDLPAHVVALGDVDVHLSRLVVARGLNGSLAVAGLQITKPAATAVANKAPSPAAKPFSMLPTVYPLISVQSVRLGADDIKLIDNSSGPNARTWRLHSVLLTNPTPIVCLGPNAARLGDINLNLTGAVLDVAKKIEISAQVQPFASLPRAAAQINVAGIQGNGLARLLPGLSKIMHVGKLTDGTFGVHAAAQLQMDRRTPIEFNFQRPFVAAITLKNMAFRAKPDGPVDAGLTEVRADKIFVDLQRRSIHIPLVNILAPAGRLTLGKHGLHVLGMVLPFKAPAPAAAMAAPKPVGGLHATAHTAAAAEPAVAGSTQQKSSATAAAALPDIIIARTVVSGLHFDFVDTTCQPPLTIPLRGLELQIMGLGTEPMFKPLPVRFNMLAYAGKVPMPSAQVAAVSQPPKDVASQGRVHPGLPAAAVKGQASPTSMPAAKPHTPAPATTAAPATAQAAALSAAPAVKSRTLFSQLAVNGQIWLYPSLHGWVKESLNGVELRAFYALAKQYGVTLAGGVFDGTTDIRFEKSSDIQTHNKLVFTDLKLAEPSKGLLAQIFHLPAPLNVVLAAIEAPDGSITLPISVPIHNGQIAMGDVEGSAIGAVAQAIAVGFASSPFKLAGGVAGLFGMGKAKPVNAPPVMLSFAPGSANLSSADYQLLAKLAKHLDAHDSQQVVVRQQLSLGDLDVMAVRANPTPLECRQLISSLRRRQTVMLQNRARLIGEISGQLAIRLSESSIAEATGQLQSLDKRLADNQNAIRYLADMLEPGAARQASRRTRGAAIKLAQARLAAIKAFLLSAGFSKAAARVHIIFPQYKPTSSQTGGQAILTLVRAGQS